MAYWLFLYNIYFLVIKLYNKQIFIFDRYAHDLLIDPVRYRYSLNENITRIILKFFPHPDLWVIMSGNPKIIWKRKKEVKLKIIINQVKKNKT